MAGSPKGGFPARRPGKLFGKKQMVMFGCIVLVLFVAPSLFGIGDTTDAHRIDPDDRGLVRTDFDGDRHRRRRFDGDDDGFDGGFRMHDAQQEEHLPRALARRGATRRGQTGDASAVGSERGCRTCGSHTRGRGGREGADRHGRDQGELL